MDSDVGPVMTTPTVHAGDILGARFLADEKDLLALLRGKLDVGISLGARGECRQN